MSNLFKDANDKVSSKRIAAAVTLATALFVAVYSIIQDPSQASNVLWPLCVSGAAMLGVTVLEKK